MTRQKLTPPQVARLWGVDRNKVLAWIHSGELRAVDSSKAVNGTRPRWLIDVDDLREFERRRESTPKKRKRRASSPPQAS